MALRETLIDLLEPGVEALGYELLELEYRVEGSRNVLRLYIDHPEGITVDHCGEVSNHVSALLDVEDPIPDAYDLEVSSPGEKRPLRKLSHFRAWVGERARVELRLGLNGRRRFTGILLGADEQHVAIDVDHEHFDLPLADIARAHLAPLVN